jgi:hypothetical protein
LFVAYIQIHLLYYLNGALDRSEMHADFLGEIIKKMYYFEILGLENILITLHMKKLDCESRQGVSACE